MSDQADPRPAQEAAASALRRMAEEVLRQTAAAPAREPPAMAPEEVERTVHDLRVHQIELEMQNEELRRAQVELDQARSRYFKLFDLAPVGYLTLSPQGRILEANLTVVTLLGVARGALVGRQLLQSIAAEDRDAFSLHFGQLVATGAAQSFELRMAGLDGSVFWARMDGVCAGEGGDAPIYRMVVSDVTREHAREEALRHAQAILQAAMDQSPAGIAIAEAPIGALRYVNEAGRRIRGPGQGGAPGDRCVSSLRMLDLDGRPLKTDEVPLARAIMYGETSRRECIIRRGEHDDRIVLANAAPIKDARGVVVAGILVFTDITERRQVDAALRESERILHESQHVARIGSYAIDLAARTWSGSAELEALCGIDDAYPRTLEGWAGLIHPDSLAETLALLERTQRSRARFEHEYRIVRRSDLQERWVHVLGELEYDTRAVPVRLIGTIQDISERRRCARTAQETALRLEAIFHGARDAIVITDPGTGIIVDINRQAETLLGRPRSQLLGLHRLDLHADERRAELRVALAGDPDGSGGLTATEVVDQDGRRIAVEINRGRVELPDGQRLEIGMYRDIRDRLLLQERLQRSQKLDAIGQLAGGLAHDFNNQLAGITGYAELLTGALADPRQRGWAEAILAAGLRSADLTRQLLVFAGKGGSRRVPMDLDTLAAAVAELLRRSINPGIVLTLEPAVAPCRIDGDYDQLQRVLLSLALNASEAMPAGGELRIAVSLSAGDAHAGSPGRTALITISDNGHGMDAETLAHLFEPYFTSKAPGRGTGLSLAAVYGVVTGHGGTIAVASTPGRGSTVTIRLPLLAAAAGPPVPAPVAVAVAATARRRILVVDDEELVRELTAEMLAMLGHEVATCTDGDAALARCRSGEAIDLVVLDLVMPRLSGYDSFLALQAARPGLRVLLISGQILCAEVAEMLARGARGFIQRPFLLADLKVAVDRALAADAVERP